MKVKVDESLCVGCGLCVDTCPRMFEMVGDVAKPLSETVAEDLVAECREGADACPVDAIIVEA